MTETGQAMRFTQRANGAIAFGHCSYRSNRFARIASIVARSRWRQRFTTLSRTKATFGCSVTRRI